MSALPTTLVTLEDIHDGSGSAPQYVLADPVLDVSSSGRRRAALAQGRIPAAPPGSFKLRGAVNAVAGLGHEAKTLRGGHVLRRQPRPGPGAGGWAAGASTTVVMPGTASAVKIRGSSGPWGQPWCCALLTSSWPYAKRPGHSRRSRSGDAVRRSMGDRRTRHGRIRAARSGR